MLNGLEISELTYSEVISNSKVQRIDSEFFIKEYLNAEKLVNLNDSENLGDCIKLLTDYHANGSYEILNKHVTLLDHKEYAYMVRTVDLEHENFDKDVIYVDEHAYNFLKKTKMYGHEIVINKIGSAGKVYLMPELNMPVTLGMNQFMLRTNDKTNEEYVYAFLNCKYGRLLTERKISGAVPPSIDKESVRNIRIPKFKNLEDIVKQIVKESFELKKVAKIIYKEANNELLTNLNMIDDKLNYSNINIKRKSQSFDVNGRIDAEYYQLKYDKLIEKLKAIDNDILSNLVTKNKSIEPGSEFYRNQGIPFIRVSNLFENKITNTSIFLDEKEIKDIENLYLKKNTILLSKDGSVGIAYKVEEDLKVVTSGAILHLKVKNTKKVLPEYLTLVLNSDIVKLQAERDSNGAIIKHWKPSEIDNVIIPILEEEKQKEITEKVNQSFELKKQSEKLLEIAKKAIEIAIEKTEDIAINYINKNK